MITLDNGMLLKNLQVPDDIFSQYKRIAANYSAKVSGDPANAILEAYLTISIMNAKQSMINAWEQICFTQQEISHRHVKYFPYIISDVDTKIT